MSEPPPGYDIAWLNDRSEFQRNWIHGLRNDTGLHLQYRVDGTRDVDGAPGPLVAADWTPSERHVGFPGFTHGGLISAVLDDIMGRLPAMQHRWVVTARLDVRFRAPAPAGRPLRVEAWLTRSSRRVVEASARMLAGDGTEVATATGTFLPLPAPLQERMVEAWPGFAAYVDSGGGTA